MRLLRRKSTPSEPEIVDPDERNENRLCVNCAFCIQPGSMNPICGRLSTTRIHLVSGKREVLEAVTCSVARSRDGGCKPGGVLYKWNRSTEERRWS